jgi:hypothetical protein
MVKHVLIHLDMETYQWLRKARGERTWRELLEIGAREVERRYPCSKETTDTSFVAGAKLVGL